MLRNMSREGGGARGEGGLKATESMLLYVLRVSNVPVTGLCILN